MALAFNSKRDALLLDDTKQEYADEPRYIFTEPAYGNEASFEEEPYAGQPTHSRLAQGSDQFDIYLTVSINRNIRAATTHGRNVQVGTLDGRVTLRGWVPSADDKARIEAIAVAATKLDLVDDQIIVGKPITAN
jgi:osmotically-inducible protein OsmY